jgi:hypothetical protein
MTKLLSVSAKVEISDLENLGWDFSNIYEEVSESQDISIEKADEFEKENYCVRLWVDEDGIVSYSLYQKAHYGNEEFYQGDPGDNEGALQDFEKLIELGLVWDFKATI